MRNTVLQLCSLGFMIIFCLQNCGGEELNIHVEKPVITFDSSYLSPDNSILALDFWMTDRGKLRRTIGFLSLNTGKLLQHKMNDFLEDFDLDTEIVSFSWYPNSQDICFTVQSRADENAAIRNKMNCLYKYNLVSSVIDTITVGIKELQAIYPVILSDAKQIIFIGFDERDDLQGGLLYIYDDQTKTTSLLLESVDIFYPVTSPDFKSIFYMKNGEIYVIDLDTGQNKQLTEFNGKIQLASLDWYGNELYFISINPTLSGLVEQMNKWLESGQEGEQPSYNRELWKMTFNKNLTEVASTENIISFRTMKREMCLCSESTLLVSIPHKNNINSANVWKYDLKNENLVQLTFGSNNDDLPIGLIKCKTVIFRRNLKYLYSVDINGKQNPKRLF